MIGNDGICTDIAILYVNELNAAMVKSRENINVHVTEAPRKWIFTLREKLQKGLFRCFIFLLYPVFRKIGQALWY